MLEPSQRRRRVGIVGAGIAGLTCARALVAHGLDVELIDKGRRAGGRITTRRHAGYAFDHGAQYLTVQDDRAAALVHEWRAAGIVAAWQPRTLVICGAGVERRDPERELLVGLPTMSAIGAQLAAPLPVLSSRRIVAVRQVDRRWLCRDADARDIGPYDVLVVALPCPQTRELLAGWPELLDATAAVRMAPCWAVMLAFDAPVGGDFDAAFVHDGPLAWVARDGSKPGRVSENTWVLHASPEWSERHLEDEPEQVLSGLVDAFARLPTGALPSVVASDAHRWRYARPTAPLDASCVYDPAGRIGLAGDWCGGAKIESAVLSGLTLADRIVSAA